MDLNYILDIHKLLPVYLVLQFHDKQIHSLTVLVNEKIIVNFYQYELNRLIMNVLQIVLVLCYQIQNLIQSRYIVYFHFYFQTVQFYKLVFMFMFMFINLTNVAHFPFRLRLLNIIFPSIAIVHLVAIIITKHLQLLFLAFHLLFIPFFLLRTIALHHSIQFQIFQVKVNIIILIDP